MILPINKTNLSGPLYITGISLTDNKFMLGGIFEMKDQVGYPLDLIILEAKEKNFHIDWLEACCKAWLNDCLKFDSFTKDIKSCGVEVDIAHAFSMTGAYILALYPKMKNTNSPVDTVCKYILQKKKLGLHILSDCK